MLRKIKSYNTNKAEIQDFYIIIYSTFTRKVRM